MALIKEKLLNNGVRINYWKVYRTNINWHEKICEVIVAGYLSEEARIAGVEPMDVYNYIWQNKDFPLTEQGGTVEQIYTKIKESKKIKVYDEVAKEEILVENNFFIDAIDLL